MQYPQDFNQKYAYLIVYEGEIYTRAHDIPQEEQHTPAELYKHLTPCYHAQLGHDNFTHYLSARGFNHPNIAAYIREHNNGQDFNPAELSADLHRVKRYEQAYQQQASINARKVYPATIPPPPAKVRKHFIKLSDLKAQPRPEDPPEWYNERGGFSHAVQQEYTIINGLIETLFEAREKRHQVNQLGDLEIYYTRANGATGVQYIPKFNGDNYTPLFIQQLNHLLQCAI